MTNQVSDYERKINKLRYQSFIVLGISIAVTTILIFFAPVETGIILLVLLWLSAALIMGYFGYKIRELRNDQMRLSLSLQQQVISIYPSQPVYSQQPAYSSESNPYGNQVYSAYPAGPNEAYPSSNGRYSKNSN
jgi:hypothetical protein